MCQSRRSASPTAARTAQPPVRTALRVAVWVRPLAVDSAAGHPAIEGHRVAGVRSEQSSLIDYDSGQNCCLSDVLDFINVLFAEQFNQAQTVFLDIQDREIGHDSVDHGAPGEWQCAVVHDSRLPLAR